MKSPINFEDLNAQLQELKKTPQYQADLHWLQGEFQQIEILAPLLLSRIPELSQICEQETVRMEYTSGVTIHRGFYCPSPVFDLIVGGTKRGKITSRKPIKEKNWRSYGFDRNGRLLWCREYFNGNLSYTEYLIHEGNHIYGIKVDSRGIISCLTDEFYEQGRLAKLLLGMFFIDGKCQELNTETYQYNNDGLVSCLWRSILMPAEYPPDFPVHLASSIPQAPILKRNFYTFHREDGLVCGYSSGDNYYKIPKPIKI